VGNFLKLELLGSEVLVTMLCGNQQVVLRFAEGSLESEILRTKLSSCKPGTKVAILKTDEPSRPLLVRLIEMKVISRLEDGQMDYGGL
jgi:hypothetical protein